MQPKKPLILMLAIAFSVHCSHGHAQENRLPLLFALAVGKARSLSVETIFFPLFPVRDALPELDSMVKAIATEIQQGDTQQREIIATAKQRGSLMLSCFRDNSRAGESAEEGIEEESETIEWWELKQEPEANDTDMPRVCIGDDIFLKSGTSYCFSPDSGAKAKAYRRAASDDSADSEDGDSEDSDSEDSSTSDEGSDTEGSSTSDEGSDTEDSSTSDESSENSSNEDEVDAESYIQCLNRAFGPLRTLNEISQHYANLRLKIHSQTLRLTDQRPRAHQCDHEGCNYSTDRAGNLKAHKRTHLPDDQRLKIHQCDHEGCSYSTDRAANLKKHKQTHLPADQRPRRPRVQCDHEGCSYSSDRSANLKKHKQTHLPADQRRRVHQCDYEGCNYSTDHPGNLKKHKQIHLPFWQRSRWYQCDYEGCSFSTNYSGSLKKHKQTHLPVEQRAKRKAYDQPPSNKKRKKGDKE
ncbi:C2H2-type zinc finger protein [Endozoicomonas sp. 4G]|uniref:C2H2-type zinc finger protein n=1 Tax=Endozoicomonas sp. 4G TaxID=2872754 RepID=UPI0020787545|nr:C2H2-type zinc finger protein [Endozoicomonas sp. 4G]